MPVKDVMGVNEYRALIKRKPENNVTVKLVKGKKNAVTKSVQYIEKICAELNAQKIPYQLEYKFDNKRGWRFDIAVTRSVGNGMRCIGIEFNGGQWNAQQGGKSRHLNGMGY